MGSTTRIEDNGNGKIGKLRKHEYFLRAGPKFSKIDDLSLWNSSGWTLSNSWEEFLDVRRKVYSSLLSSEPNIFQTYWMYLLYSGNNVVTLAPVGSGKTTYAIIEALLSGGKVIFVAPTRVLMRQVYERLREFASLLGLDKRIVIYDSRERQRILGLDFDIAVLSPQSFRLVFEHLRSKIFLAVVDDVDAFIKNPRNLDRLFAVLSKRGRVIFASATARIPPEQSKVLREKFGISFVKSRFIGYRNVVDIFAGDVSLREVLATLMQKIGAGGLVFVRRGRDTSDVVSVLNDLGISWHEADEEGLKKFASGEVDVLVGKASFYGKAVRGLDLPQRIRFALFVGVPSLEITLGPDEEEVWEWLSKYGISRSEKDPVEAVRKLAEERGWYLDLLEDGRIRLSFPDFTTYIQASGRTSRLLGGDYTLGVSVVWEDSERRRFLDEFVRRSSWFGLNWSLWDEVSWDLLGKTVEESRLPKEGRPFKAYLFLVESPHKVETILRILGGGVFRYWKLNGWMIKVGEVVFGRTLYIIGPTIGHTNDIVTRCEDDSSIYGVVREENAFYPIMDTVKMTDQGTLVSIPDGYHGDVRDKLDLLVLYRRLSAVIGAVLLSTDPDSEGERIAYEVGAYLAPYTSEIKRAEFHSITKGEVLRALDEVRQINVNRFEAALTRRIEDRWVGFSLSEVVQHRFGRRNLSAGRVQTPVLGWVIDAYERYQTKVERWKVCPRFLRNFCFLLPPDISPDDISVTFQEKEISPLPPFSTDEMLRVGISRLGLPASRIMELAQDLFEGGYITYHRTDSTRVSDEGLMVARRYLEAKYGADIFTPRHWMSKKDTRLVQAAHEAIRPTKPLTSAELARLTGERLSRDHLRLYDLIFRRFMASQMISAIVRVVGFESNGNSVTEAVVDVLKPGFSLEFRYFRVYELIGDISEGYTLQKVTVPSGYPLTEADVVALMKDRGIGRPSTYGKIIETLKERRYVRLSPNGWLIPTDLGREVFAFLHSHYPDFTAEERTRILYQRMDKVENGEEDYMRILWDIYGELREVGLLGDVGL